MDNIKFINKSQIKKIILEKIIKKLNEDDADSDEVTEDFDSDEVSITDKIISLFYNQCLDIIENDELMKAIENLFNKKKSITDNLPFFNNSIKKEINKYLYENVDFEKLCQDDENLKIYFTKWKQIPIDNYQQYTEFFKSISNDDEIDDNKQKEYNELILKSKFKILLNGNEKKICIMLDSSEAEYVRDQISNDINAEDSDLYISQQKSYYTGDEDWIDYFEGDEGDGFTAATSLASAGIAKNQIKKVGSFVKNKTKDFFKPKHIDYAVEVPPNKMKLLPNKVKLLPNKVKHSGDNFNIINSESHVKSHKKINKLNEGVFLIPVLKFLGQVVIWAAAEYFFKKYLIIPDSNWIESRKLYVFNYNEGDINEVDEMINNYQEFIEKLKKQHGGTDPTEITDQIIDVFIYFLRNIEDFSKQNNLPLANNQTKLNAIKKDIQQLENISDSDNKMHEFRKFLKLDNSKKSKPSISLLKNFKKIVNERNIDLEKESTENITNEIYQYYLEKFNESKNN